MYGQIGTAVTRKTELQSVCISSCICLLNKYCYRSPIHSLLCFSCPMWQSGIGMVHGGIGVVAVEAPRTAQPITNFYIGPMNWGDLAGDRWHFSHQIGIRKGITFKANKWVGDVAIKPVVPKKTFTARVLLILFWCRNFFFFFRFSWWMLMLPVYKFITSCWSSVFFYGCSTGYLCFWQSPWVVYWRPIQHSLTMLSSPLYSIASFVCESTKDTFPGWLFTLLSQFYDFDSPVLFTSTTVRRSSLQVLENQQDRRAVSCIYHYVVVIVIFFTFIRPF